MKRDFQRDLETIENYIEWCNWLSHDIWSDEEMEQSKEYIFTLIEEGTIEEIENFLERNNLNDAIASNEASDEEFAIYQLFEEVKIERV